MIGASASAAAVILSASFSGFQPDLPAARLWDGFAGISPLAKPMPCGSGGVGVQRGLTLR